MLHFRNKLNVLFEPCNGRVEVEPFLVRMRRCPFELRTPRYSSSKQVNIFEDFSSVLCHFASRYNMSRLLHPIDLMISWQLTTQLSSSLTSLFIASLLISLNNMPSNMSSNRRLCLRWRTRGSLTFMKFLPGSVAALTFVSGKLSS